MQNIDLGSGPVEIAGAVSIEQTPEGLQPWRLPIDQIKLFEPPLIERASAAAGVRLRLRSDTRSLRLDLQQVPLDPPDAGRFDLYVDGNLHQSLPLELDARTLRFDNIAPGSPGSPETPAGPGTRATRELEIYLPQFTAVRLQALAIDDDASAQPWPDRRPRWITYGSSITHCRAAASPGMTWPAIVARRSDLNLTCLGYGGQCHLDPPVARMIRDLPADYISLCLGINVMGAASLSQRTFRAAAIGLVQTIRDGHPQTPIAIISPLYNPPRETQPNTGGLHLQAMRDILLEVTQTLRDHGDNHLHYINGKDLFGPEFLHHLPDELHPDAQGYQVLADRFSDMVMPTLLESQRIPEHV